MTMRTAIRVHPHCGYAGGRSAAEDLLSPCTKWVSQVRFSKRFNKELQRYPEQRASKVAVRIGEFAGVDPESLRFCFEAMVKETELAPLALEIEWCRVADGAAAMNWN